MTGTNGARWGVVGTMDEPAALIAAHAAHHLAIGAEQVHIFLDRANPEAEALLRGIDGLHLHHSGEDGWARHWRGKRPDRHEGRQKYNATRILDECGLDWLIHCDADEFVDLKRPLEWELEKTGDQKAWLRLEVDERCFVGNGPGETIFSGAFRRLWPDFATEGAELYGADRVPLLNRGVGGHVAGKPITRTGRDYAIGVHFPLKHWDSKENELPYRSSYNARLLHFDGLTPLHFILKMLRAATRVVKGEPVPFVGTRLAQFNAAAAVARDPEKLREFWWRVQGVSGWEAFQLEQKKVLTRPDLSIVTETAALFGDRVDLSPAAFDRALIAHEAELIGRLHEAFGFDPAPLMSA